MKNLIMTLADPWLLLLMLALVPAFLLALFRKAPSVRMPSLTLFRAVPGAGKRGIKGWLPLILYAAAGICFVIALARPREGLEQIRRRTEGIDIILALDLSGSMQAFDVPSGMDPNRAARAVKAGILKNRLKTAQSEIIKFINARPNDRIGLIGFSHLPYMVCPPTLDHAWLIANLSRLKPGITSENDNNPMKFATNLASPLAVAAHRLKDSDARRKVIVLFTDGASNVSAKVTPLQAAKLASTFEITVYTVGIGAPMALYPQTGPFGTRLISAESEFDEPLLKQIADTASGHYYHAGDAESMAAAMKAIDRLEKTSFEQQTLINWRELAPLFIMAGAILLLAGFLMENTVFLKAP